MPQENINNSIVITMETGTYYYFNLEQEQDDIELIDLHYFNNQGFNFTISSSTDADIAIFSLNGNSLAYDADNDYYFLLESSDDSPELL